ncbi:MAG: glycosyltransferase family 1 protein [Patescibacteria group bacterium]
MEVVGIDLRSLPTDGTPGRGVAHAARFLTEALVVRDVPWKWNVYLPKGAAPLAETAWERCRFIELRDETGSSLRRALKAYPCDLLIVPAGATPPGLSVPAVPWVHDVAIFDHPEWFPQSFLRRSITTTLFRHGLERAPFVLAVSEDTKAELVSRFHLDPSRVIVTLEGGDPFLHALHSPNLEEHKRAAKLRVAATGVTNAFVLALGTVDGRKNIAMLIQAWRRACPLISRPVDLVIAGRDGWKLADVHSALYRHIQAETDGSRIHRIHVVDDDARRDMLLAADIVAVPSLHEGFGLVALEGMQAGTAVLASAMGALPEVVADAGIQLDPRDQESWSLAMAGIMNDDVSRIDMALAGKSRSQKFTWDHAAMKVVEGIQELSS